MDAFRKSGIEVVGDIPWGTHICQFYQNGSDLAEILVPYFNAGLKTNELCLWITTDSFNEENAGEAMREILPDFDSYLKKGQMEIIPYDAWYLRNGAFKPQTVLDAWASKLAQALSMGYDGLRISGDVSWINESQWSDFACYEKKVNEWLDSNRMLAVCSYPTEKCGANEVIDIVRNHQITLSRQRGQWGYVENTKRKRMVERLQESERKYRCLFDDSPISLWLGDLSEVKTHLDMLSESGIEDCRKHLSVHPEEVQRCMQMIGVLDVNRSTLDLLRVENKEAFKNGLTAFFSEESHEVFREGFMAMTEGKVCFESEVVNLTTDGEKRHTILRAAVVPGFEETFSQVVVSMIDITGRNQVEKELRAHKERLEELIDERTVELTSTNKRLRKEVYERKQAEDALRQNEELLSKTLEILPVGVWMTDRDGRIFHGNREGQKIWGGARYVGIESYDNYKGWWLDTGRRIEQEDWASTRAISRGETSLNEQIEIECFDGTHKIIQNSAVPIRGSKGEILGAVVVNQDITAHKAIENALRSSNELLERIFSSIELMIAYMDKDFTFIRVNRAYALADEREPDFYVGKNHFDLYHDEESETVFRRVVETGEPFSATAWPLGYPAHSERGTSYWNLSLHPVKDTSGMVVDGLILSMIDVTEREHALSALRASEEHFRAVVESAQKAIISCNHEGRIVCWNKSATTVFGYSEKEVLGEPITVLMPDRYLEAHARGMSRWHETGEGHVIGETVELYGRRKDGGEFPCELSLATWSSEKGIFCTAIVRDITERKETEKRTHTTNSLLKLFSQTCSRKEYFDAAVKLLSTWSGCRCAGLRVLDENGNIPYVSCNGFSQEFCELESPLSLTRDQCACIRVISEKPEPQDASVMTAAGSFYCNDILGFVESLSEQERARFRGVCIEMGFRSIAVVPVRYQNKIFGAIHLADERMGKVPRHAVEFLESMAPLIGEAIHRLDIEEDLRHNYDTQSIINSLLHLSLGGLSLHGILEHALEAILSIPWLSSESSGAIFLAEQEPGFLLMNISKGLCESCLSVCERVPVGRCLCGRAASSQKIVFADRIDEAQHQILYEDIKPHGHYCAPILSSGRTLGVINLCLKEGHPRNPREEEFLRTVAMTLAGIIERRKTESERMLLSAAIEQAAEYIVVFDHNKNIQYVNQALERIIGYARGELIGQHARNIRTTKRDGAIVRKMWETVERGEVWTGNFVNLTRQGTEYEIEALISPLRDASGSIFSYVALGRDLGQQRKLEQQLWQAQKMQAIGTLAGGIAHDFNNILMIIAGSIETALDVAPNENRLQRRLKRALSSCQRGKDLVKQFLSFSRKSEQEKKPVQIALLVKEAMKLLRASLPSTIEIQQNIENHAQGRGLVRADPTQIHQVIMNLCTNAAHAMQAKGGVLEVSLVNVEVDQASAARHLDLEPGPYAKLTVRDTGHGMNREVVQRVFEPFYTTKPKGEGTGLGLTVVHNIVKSHNGVIMVESEPGIGSAFEIFIPRTEQDERHEEREEEPLDIAGKECILLVDDEEFLVDATVELLESLGYTVISKTNSLDALDAFRKEPHRFDVVITDLTMPKMTGIELARELIRIRPGIPVILCTGFIEPLVQMTAKAAGILDFLIKPIDRSEMASTIRKIFDHLPND